MLENIRENSQGLVAKIILGFIILTFAIAGIGSYTNSVDTSVAEVNGEKISQADFDKAYQTQRNRMAQQYGEMFETLSSDANYMANFRNSVVDSLINQMLVDQASNDMAIRISDERLKKTIREMPEFQVDGKFDNNRYLALINQAGFYQSSNFRDYLRSDINRRQLTQALVASEFGVPYQEALISSLQSQKRQIRFATITQQQYQEGIEVSDEEINNYYLENQQRFENQEKVKVNYLVIDVNDIAKSIEVSDADIDSYYQENIANYRQEEQRRIAHILKEFGEDKAKAKAEIEAIKARIDSGEDFASLAKELSDDTFSGENGGDLAWLELGVMDPAFEQAATALPEINAVSDIVESEFGYHLVKLTELKAGQITALVDVKEELRAKVSKQKAADKFFELQQQAGQLSFEFPDSLDDAAKAIGIEVKTSDWLAHFGNAAPFDNAKIIEAAFSDVVVQERLNSEVIEVNDSLAVVLRINEYQAANTKPLAEVSEQIKSLLVQQKASEKAQTVADELLTSFKAGEDISEQLAANGSEFSEAKDIARYGSDIEASLAREAFKLPHPQEGSIVAATVALANGDLALLELLAVNNVEAKAPESFSQQYTQQLAQSAYQSYVEALREQAKISKRASIAASNQL